MRKQTPQKITREIEIKRERERERFYIVFDTHHMHILEASYMY